MNPQDVLPPALAAALPPALVLAAFALFARKRLLTYLHVYQQEEYDGRRFLAWMARTAGFDRRATIALALIGFAAPVLAGPLGALTPWVVAALAAGALLAVAAVERDPRRAAKKKLALTARARRILWAASVPAGLAGLAVAVAGATQGAPVWLWLLPVQALPLCLVLGNLALMPAERRVQRRYWIEAHDKLTRLAPTVIGITGSFGKTSVKHILGHVLETVAPTLITPGSVNTPMGIARVVRESLGPQHRFFVCEMGAYGPGSIARLCRLAPPDAAVITAIGMAHYERFKTLETVARAKFELAEATIARGGSVVVPAALAEIGPAGEAMAADPASFLVCGAPDAEPAPGLVIRQAEETPDGVVADVVWQGTDYRLAAPLYGAHHATNMALAFAAACTLGVKPADAQRALRSVPQIAHRLEVKRQGDGSLLIDDAYNSNPVGFAAALETLARLKQREGGRAIVVTPGMVELGTAHDSEHERIGRRIAEMADVLVAVAPQRVESLIAGYEREGGGEAVRCPTFADAQSWLAANRGRGDVVLLENDLPDLYEYRLSL